MNVHVEGLTVGPFQENCYFLRRQDSPETVVIDPGDEAPRIISYLEQQHLVPVVILNTHAHLDHIGAVAALKDRFGISFRLHGSDLDTLTQAPDAARLYGVSVPEVPRVDQGFDHGERIQVAGLAIEVRHTPGHTPGGVCFVVEDVVFSGDTLFLGSVGRTDLPGGDWDTLLESISLHLLSLPDPTRVYSGHGPATTIGRERRLNPFLKGLSPGTR